MMTVIHQLAELFFNLEFCEAAAVTPTIELAKLALVTSRDEEDDEVEVDRGGTDSSNDTEATLVDDGPSRPGVTESSSYTPERATGTVLGKRTRDVAPLSSTDMEVDSPIPGSPKDNGSFTTVSSANASASPPPPSVASSSKHPHAEKSDGDGDIEMEPAPAPQKPPPLPPRKPAVKSESVMMFGMLIAIHCQFLNFRTIGKQHDVAECMDNCMFQIETALLNFSDKSGTAADGDKTSVVKRLFSFCVSGSRP